MSYAPSADNLPLARLQARTLLVAAGSIVLGVVGWVTDATQFYQSYLFAYSYWWTVTMGCLGLSLLYQMTGGQWGYAARPFFDSGVRTLPILAVGFVPLAMGMDDVYEWTRPGYFAGEPHATNRAWYLQKEFFIGRTVVCYAICILLGWLLTYRVVLGNGTMKTRQVPTLGGLGAVLVVNIVTLEAVDWTMSLKTHYYSTMHGAIFVGGALLCGVSLAAAGVAWTTRAWARTDEQSITIVHDLGKLLLAMLMVWAYLSFSQYLISYAGNLPFAAEWYLDRLRGGWQWLGVGLILFHFAIPFLLLISRSLKRQPVSLGWIAVGLLVIHATEVFWIVAPAFHPSDLSVHWLDGVVLVAIGSAWLAEFFRQLKHRLKPLAANWPYPEASHD